MEKRLPVPSEPPTVSSQETSDHGGLSPERVDKAQQLIDEYGVEEGLRRFREMDSDAAERFESVPRPPFREQTGQERRNPPAHDTSEDAASTQ